MKLIELARQAKEFRDLQKKYFREAKSLPESERRALLADSKKKEKAFDEAVASILAGAVQEGLFE